MNDPAAPIKVEHIHKITIEVGPRAAAMVRWALILILGSLAGGPAPLG